MTDAYNRTRVNLRCVLLSVLTESRRVSRMRIRAPLSVLLSSYPAAGFPFLRSCNFQEPGSNFEIAESVRGENLGEKEIRNSGILVSAESSVNHRVCRSNRPGSSRHEAPQLAWPNVARIRACHPKMGAIFI